MSGELDETQFVSCLLPRGRGNRSVGTELDTLAEGVCGEEEEGEGGGSVRSSVKLMADRRFSFECRSRTVAGVSDW